MCERADQGARMRVSPRNVSLCITISLEEFRLQTETDQMVF
jgi:hypothetical protein